MADLSAVTTKELQEELLRREGVESIPIKPYDTCEIFTHHEGIIAEFTGPTILTINHD